MIRKRVWVANQPEGIGHDGTYAYIDEAAPIELPPGSHVVFDRGLVYVGALDDDSMRRAQEVIAKAVAQVGHGDPDVDAALGPPRVEFLDAEE